MTTCINFPCCFSTSFTSPVGNPSYRCHLLRTRMLSRQIDNPDSLVSVATVEDVDVHKREFPSSWNLKTLHGRGFSSIRSMETHKSKTYTHWTNQLEPVGFILSMSCYIGCWTRRWCNCGSFVSLCSWTWRYGCCQMSRRLAELLLMTPGRIARVDRVPHWAGQHVVLGYRRHRLLSFGDR